MSLTDEEMRILDSLSAPDAESESKYTWDQDFQREILSLLLNDRFFLIQSMDLIKSGYFTNEPHQVISRILFNYFKKYKTNPSKIQIIQELKFLLSEKDSKTRVNYINELNYIYEYYLPRIDTRDYYIDKITNFAKTMSLKAAFSKCLEEIEMGADKEETWSNIHNILKKSLEIDRNFDVGLDYFSNIEERYERMKEKIEKGEFFVTGFKNIDDAISGGGLSRGELGSIVGVPGTGKSLFLVKAAISNIQLGKKVLYISLEIDQDKVAERFDAQFANPECYTNSNGIGIGNLLDNETKVIKILNEYAEEFEDKKMLYVKQFPAGQLDIPLLRAYFSQLKVNGFMPDLLIIDYVGEMKDYPNMPTWQSRQYIVRDLRGMAVEENICVLTAMQPEKKGQEVIKLGGVLDLDNLADSYGQTRPLDCLWTLNQLPDEKACSLGRIFIAKHRFGKSRFTIFIEFDYDTLSMRQISESRYKSIKMHYQNTKNVDANEILKMEQENSAKIENFKKATENNKKKKEVDEYSIVGEAKFNDIGYDSEEALEEIEQE